MGIKIFDVKLFLQSVSRPHIFYQKMFCTQTFSKLISGLAKTPVSGSGSGVPNQRLRVYVLFQLSTTWLNSTVKGSAPRLLMSRIEIEILA